jgi:hypothetical protein
LVEEKKKKEEEEEERLLVQFGEPGRCHCGSWVEAVSSNRSLLLDE